jgi:hypothetical protein
MKEKMSERRKQTQHAEASYGVTDEISRKSRVPGRNTFSIFRQRATTSYVHE